MAEQPIRRFDAGVIVTINPDDALIFGRGVSQEFLSLFEANLSMPTNWTAFASLD